LKDHPKLKETLIMPLSGEPRVAYCYVHSDKTKEFKKYIKTNLNQYCKVYKSTDLINKGVFGLGKINEKLKDRIGDYVLVMKENYILKDFLITEEEKYHIGNHGGTSKDEMFVPVVRFDC